MGEQETVGPQYREREAEQSREHHRKLAESKGMKPEDLSLFTVGELYEGESPRDGDMWGPWRFQQKNLTLQLEGEYAHFHREIDLEKLGSPTELLNWLHHYLGKVWGNPEVIGNLIVALYDLTFSEWWGNPNLNLSKIIKERYGKTGAIR